MAEGLNEWKNKLIDIKGDQLTYVRRGVLWIERKPHYIVELIKEPDLTYVAVYKVHPGTEKNPQKLAQEVVEKRNVFSSNTKLGQLANAIFPSKTVKKWVPKDPVFIAPVIPNKKNTFTGKIEDGFFEREEDRVVVQGGQRKIIRGRNTGVFIGLSSIDWEDKISIPTESILRNLRNYQKDMFYDLTSNNTNLNLNQNKNNLLSTYFDDGTF